VRRAKWALGLRSAASISRRTHGVLAPNAKLRSEIIPSPSEIIPSPVEQATEPACDHAQAQGAPARMSWARRLKRVFDIDIDHCPNCGGSLKIIAAIEDPLWHRAPAAFRVRVWAVTSRGCGPRVGCPPPESVDLRHDDPDTGSGIRAGPDCPGRRRRLLFRPRRPARPGCRSRGGPPSVDLDSMSLPNFSRTSQLNLP
jgi:hypothetical protein